MMIARLSQSRWGDTHGTLGGNGGQYVVVTMVQHLVELGGGNNVR